MKRTLAIILLTASASLAGCGERNEGGLTPEENRELNEAAEMLDTSPDNLVPGDDLMLTNGDEPIELDGGVTGTNETASGQ